MSDQRLTAHTQINPARSKDKGLARRLSIYVVLAIVGVLALAWFDGGEEPIHPIVQSIALPQGAGEGE